LISCTVALAPSVYKTG